MKPTRRTTRKVPRYQLIGEKSMKFMKEANARLKEKESKERKRSNLEKHSKTGKRSIQMGTKIILNMCKYRLFLAVTHCANRLPTVGNPHPHSSQKDYQVNFWVGPLFLVFYLQIKLIYTFLLLFIRKLQKVTLC